MNVEEINLPTVPPTNTDFDPVFVYLPNVQDKIMDQTTHTNKRIIDFFKKMNIVPPALKKPVAKVKDKVTRQPTNEIDDENMVSKENADVVDKDKMDDELAPELLKNNAYADNLPVFKPPFKFSGKMPVSSYYMNNRKMFVQFIDKMFEEYRLKLLENSDPITCDTIGKNSKMDLMTHQKLIRDYMNLYTPYRGLLLIHGLGSGKTCSSIGIAEGFRNQRKIIVMTPAYLQSNYISEIKKCGDMMYRLKQHWNFIDTTKKEKDMATKDKMDIAQVLRLPDDFIKKLGGYWLMNVNKKDSNYHLLDERQQKSLDEQLNLMIHNKYTFINYNGITAKKFNQLTKSLKVNIFNNSVVIIDEVHNFVSWIVNKINTTKDYTTIKKPNLAVSFYKMLMEAQNCRIVMLSGTPIMNYPNEIAILFNILRGYIYTFTLSIDDSKHKGGQPLDTKYFTSLLSNVKDESSDELSAKKMVDYVQYNASKKTLIVTRNPLGFENEYSKQTDVYKGVKYEPNGSVESDLVVFKKNLVQTLQTAKFSVSSVSMVKNLALPDKLEEFQGKYLDTETREIKNLENFKRRIIGLVSYFRSADEALLPQFSKKEDIHTEYMDMSDLQFGVYAQARMQEIKSEKGARVKAHMQIYQGDGNSSSSYRIYSRLFCNFVFPPNIIRPIPAKKGKKDNDKDNDKDKDTIDNKEDELAKDVIDANAKDSTEDSEDMVGMEGNKQYTEQLKKAFHEIDEKKSEYLRLPQLTEYSPKYAKILKNIQELRGKHLVYSQFRTMEGIGLFSLALDANGFQQFRIKRVSGGWEFDINENDIGKKPMYALYTGTEDKEEREIVRHIYNGDWDIIPQNLKLILDKAKKNNVYGDIIKVFMITASGSEGINLMETRYVHIMEPFWHSVRTEQVIGRARRICSHKKLSLEDQTVEVFLYMMQFTKKQLSEAPEINKHDVGKLPENSDRVLTSDEKLFETGQIKETINSQLIMGMKEASIDCSVYTKNNSQEGVQCFQFNNAKPNEFIYTPDYKTDPDIITQKRVGPEPANSNKQSITKAAATIAKIIQYKGEKYVYEPGTNNVYDYETFTNNKQRRKKLGVLNESTGRIDFDKQ